MAIVWFIRYRRIQTNDPDFPRTRKHALIGSTVGVTILIFTGIHVLHR